MNLFLRKIIWKKTWPKKLQNFNHRSESKPHFGLPQFRVGPPLWTTLNCKVLRDAYFSIYPMCISVARHSYKTCKDLGTPSPSLFRVGRGREVCRWGPCVVLLGIFNGKELNSKSTPAKSPTMSDGNSKINLLPHTLTDLIFLCVYTTSIHYIMYHNIMYRV